MVLLAGSTIEQGFYKKGMLMGRDPAFLFYDGDASRDVSHMNRLERGCYFDIIQAQRKFGKLKIEYIKKILGKDFDACWFSIEMIMTKEDDLFFIQWLDDSIEKRKVHSEKQRKRIKEYWDKKKNLNRGNTTELPANNRGNTTVLPLENENENENENEIKTEKETEKEIIAMMNEILGTKYRNTPSNIKLVTARLKEGFSVDDFKAVFRDRKLKWENTDMQQYLRPKTLLCASKFEGYLNDADRISPKKEGYHNVTRDEITSLFSGVNFD